MKRFFDVLIIGAGHAGAQAAISLRQNHFSGSVAIIGSEPELPYQRPPLSKEYLSGEKSFDKILIRPGSFWDSRNVELLLGQTVTRVDPPQRQVELANGDSADYGNLVWTTGGHPRHLTCPGHDLPGVHYVRSRADVDSLLADLESAARVAVIGGGYIGLEAAAVLNKLGKSVTIFEAQNRVLSRVAGEALSRFYENEHRGRGVEIRLKASVDRIEERDGRVGGVRLNTGELVEAEVVIVGIGIIPAVGPLIAAGAKGANGVLVDASCRTSLPNVYAAGDCAAHVNRFSESQEPIRLESLPNASDQADVVAKCLTGHDAVYHSVPWFWSNQYDLRLQAVGLMTGHDHVVLRGEPATRRFSVIYLRGQRVLALDCVNAAGDFVHGRALVESRVVVDVDKLADPAIALKDVPLAQSAS